MNTGQAKKLLAVLADVEFCDIKDIRAIEARWFYSLCFAGGSGVKEDDQ